MAGEHDWTLTWTATTIDADTIADAADLTSDAISNDTKLDTEVAVMIAYGATANQGVKVYVLREGASAYEAEADNPWGFEMPYSTSTTHRRTFTVPASIGRFQVLLTNDSGASVTADVDYRQAVAAA